MRHAFKRLDGLLVFADDLLAADERAGLTGPCEIQWVLADDSPSWHCDGTMHAMLSDGLFPLMIAL